jgi:hypothetical protein
VKALYNDTRLIYHYKNTKNSVLTKSIWKENVTSKLFILRDFSEIQLKPKFRYNSIAVSFFFFVRSISKEEN